MVVWYMTLLAEAGTNRRISALRTGNRTFPSLLCSDVLRLCSLKIIYILSYICFVLPMLFLSGYPIHLATLKFHWTVRNSNTMH